MKEVSIISKVVSRGKAEALPSASASMPNWAELAKYVTLDGDETIYGVKNFANGLMIGGLPLIKIEDDVVYLDAHLVVRGGITMFGTGEDVDVPTIMDALSVDGVNLQVINGVLTFVGEATGGVADSVRWENVIGRPTLLSSFTDDIVAGKYLPLNTSTTNILTSSQSGVLNFKSTSSNEVGIRLFFNETNGGGLWYNGVQGMYLYNAASATQLGLLNDGTPYYQDLTYNKRHLWHSGNFNPENYLPLSGGTLTGSGNDILVINRTNGYPYIRFMNNGKGLAYFGVNTSKEMVFLPQNDTEFLKVLHSGNYSDYALPYTGGRLSNSDTSLFINRTTANTYPHITFESQGNSVGDIGVSFDGTKPVWYNYSTKTWNDIITSDNAANYNVGSATKLQTARTIWGQSFDGTGNVSGDIDLLSVKIGRYKTLSSANDASILSWKGKDGGYLGYIGYYTDHFIFCNHKGGVENSGISAYDDGKIEFFSNNGGKPLMILQNGNVGISVPATTFAEFTLSTLKSKSHFCLHHNNVFGVYMMVDYNSGAFAIQSGYQNQAKALDISLQPRGGKVGIGTLAPSCSLHVVGDILSTGGITMYSDQRKKTILNHVELSLKQIAEAPLIEHYYNSDDSKTTHVGSIAQYWAEMNDWFCKKDNEGFYTMEIQNCALASAISIARELVKFESKTDKKIRLLKKRIGELEEEIKKLKTA